MTVSKKQVAANRQNAQKGGVKTAKGKEIARYNALKHGLLAKEAVITIGEGAEDPNEFNTLVDALTAQFKPEGSLEAILVEKIAVAYWRLRRAYRYEAGLIRRELDTVTDDFYAEKSFGDTLVHKTDEQIHEEVPRPLR